MKTHILKQVSQHDADELQNNLKELTDEWHESCEVMRASKIYVGNIPDFLDHIKRTHEGNQNIKTAKAIEKKVI